MLDLSMQGTESQEPKRGVLQEILPRIAAAKADMC